MADLFSQRHGYKKAAVLRPDVMPESLRKRLWNAIAEFIEGHHERNEIIERIWDEVLKQDKDELCAHYGVDTFI